MSRDDAFDWLVLLMMAVALAATIAMRLMQ